MLERQLDLRLGGRMIDGGTLCMAPQESVGVGRMSRMKRIAGWTLCMPCLKSARAKLTTYSLVPW